MMKRKAEKKEKSTVISRKVGEGLTAWLNQKDAGLQGSNLKSKATV